MTRTIGVDMNKAQWPKTPMAQTRMIYQAIISLQNTAAELGLKKPHKITFKEDPGSVSIDLEGEE